MTEAANPMHRLKFHAGAAVALALLCAAASAQTSAPTLIETAADVLKLPPMDAMGKVPRPVRLRGVVLAVNASRSTVYIHDGTSGIGVMLRSQTTSPAPGDEVVIEGRAVLYRVFSFTHTRVQANTITIEGRRPFPSPAQIDIATLNTFSNYDQWISLEGYVIEWKHVGSTLSIKFVDDRDLSTAHVSVGSAADIPLNIIGARVRLTGVNTGDHTALNALTVPDRAHIEVLTPGYAGVFDAPLASFKDVISRKVESGKRYRVQGVVAAISGKSHLYLKGSDGALTCLLYHRANDPRPGVIYGDAGPLPTIAPGDQVEVEGSAIGEDAGLMWSHVRVTGKGEAPKPEATDIRTLQSFAGMDHWITLEGIVHAWTSRKTQTYIALSDATGSINVLLRECPPDTLPKDLFGARVRLTGMSQTLARSSGAALLQVPGLPFFEMIKPGSADPFDAPDAPLASIKDQSVPAVERVRTKGVITGLNGPSVYLRSGKAAARVQIESPWPRPEGDTQGMTFADAGPTPPLVVGDEVEVVGTPLRFAGDADQSLHDLVHAYVRVAAHQSPPEPVAATLPDIVRGVHDADLVQVSGRMISLQPTPLTHGEWQYKLMLEADEARLPVTCLTRSATAFATLKVDDEVVVHGLVNRATAREPRGLWLSAAEDAKSMGLSPVVRMRQRLLLGGGIALAFGVLAAWVLLLLRNQRMQSAAAHELKAAAEAMRASEQRWRLLFDQSPLSVQIFSPDGQTKLFNQAWKNLFLLNDEQGYAFNVLKAPDLIASGAVNHIRKAFEGQVVHVPPVPYPIPGDPPATRWIGGVLYPLKSDAGEITEVVVIHHDITETKRAEDAMLAMNQTLEMSVNERTAELQKTQAELERALEQERELGELKSRFVTMVSHEFRTPLGIIMSAVELLQHYSDRLPAEEKQRQLQEIQSSTKHMGGLMEQVLLLGRAEAGKLSCKPLPLDLACFAERIIDETQSISNRKCPITLQTEGDIADARVDEALLRHILGNLVANAVKYSPEGSEVALRIHRESADVVFDIIDQGIGIPEKDRARLFEAFHRCSNVGDTPGTGLGLVIVKRCVDIHGGTLDIESEPGRGTTFTVRLPVFS